MKNTLAIIDESAMLSSVPAIKSPKLAEACKGNSPAPRPTPDLHQTRTKPDAGPAFERDYFTYRGKDWRIYKRGTGPKAKWYLHFEHRGKRYQHSCGEVAKKAAIETAKIKIDAVMDGHKDALKASMHRSGETRNYSSIGELVGTFEKMVLDIGENTRNTYVNCFRLVLSKALGVKVAEVNNESAAVLSKETGRRYFEAVLVESQKQKAQKEQTRVKRSGNSIFNQAKSMLRPKVLAGYERAGLVLPDVDGFLSMFKAERFEGVTERYDPPSDRAIRQTLHGWLKLTDRNQFLSVGLALACGLRKGEIQQVTWGMFTRSMGSPVLDGRGHVKNQSGAFCVTPIDPYWQLLMARIEREKWRGKDDELLLQGTVTELTDTIFRDIGTWMRDLGWTTQKTNHALRAYSGSMVAMKYGIYRASAWLRHSSVKVTQGHYMHFLDGRVFKPEKIRIRWAR